MSTDVKHARRMWSEAVNLNALSRPLQSPQKFFKKCLYKIIGSACPQANFYFSYATAATVGGIMFLGFPQGFFPTYLTNDMAENLRTLLLVTVMLSSIGITSQAQPTRVIAIPTASTNFFTAGNLVYFTSDDSLLRTDVTAGGTIFLRSGFTTALSQFTNFNDLLFFTAGTQLWRSDGTPGGTIQLTTKADLMSFQELEPHCSSAVVTQPLARSCTRRTELQRGQRS
jgi:hypothetical protein